MLSYNAFDYFSNTPGEKRIPGWHVGDFFLRTGTGRGVCRWLVIRGCCVTGCFVTPRTVLAAHPQRKGTLTARRSNNIEKHGVDARSCRA